jgi:hypothetical protein
MLASAGAAGGVLLIIYLAGIVVSLIGTVKILTKAGYSGWWVLIAFVPLVNFRHVPRLRLLRLAQSPSAGRRLLRQPAPGRHLVAIAPGNYPPPQAPPPPGGGMA